MLDIHFEIDRLGVNDWDDFVITSPKGHLLQSSPWAQLKSASGWDAALVTVQDGQDVLAGAQVLFRSLPVIGKLRPITIGYVPKGPVINYTDTLTLTVLVQGLDQLCRKRGAILLKIEPDEPQSNALRETLTMVGFRPSGHTIQPPSTILIDLSQGMETCLSRMSSKTRYNIRLAERKGVKVHTGSEEDMARFYELAVTTGQRDRFAIHHPDYYRQAYRLFREKEAVQLFLADFEGKLLAGLMAFAFGHKSWYLYGASSNEERQRMPNHALQWAAINWAKSKGCLSYDLWGIPDEAPMLEANQETRLKAYLDNPPPGSLWGIYRFKRGFGGNNIRYIGAYDRVYSPVLYWLYEKVANLRQGPPA